MPKREFDLTDADAAFIEVARPSTATTTPTRVQAALTVLRCHDFGGDPRELAREHLLIDEADREIAAGRYIDLAADEVGPWLDAKLQAVLTEDKDAA